MDTYDRDGQYDEVNEELNPWVSIIYQPRATIRYVLDSGLWSNIWLVYAIVFVGTLPSTGLGMFLQPYVAQMPGMPDGVSTNVFSGIMFAVFFVIGFPIGMVMLYLIGLLYRVVGSWLDGEGNAREMRIALTWSYVWSMYFSWMMLLPYGMLVYVYQTTENMEPDTQIMISLVQVGVSMPIMIAYSVVASKTIGEAHRFSAWRGLGTLFISFLIMMAIMVFLMIMGFALLFAIGLAIGAMS